MDARKLRVLKMLIAFYYQMEMSQRLTIMTARRDPSSVWVYPAAGSVGEARTGWVAGWVAVCW